jgi:hypothetical protein
MADAGYVVNNTSDVALTAATAKTILAVIAGTNKTFKVTELSVSFDGTSATAEPVTVELCYSDETTAGTKTSFTPLQIRGPTRTVDASANVNYTVQNGTLTVWKTWLVHPQTGITIQHPLGREPEELVTADALCIRCTAPATVNVRGYMEWEEG